MWGGSEHLGFLFFLSVVSFFLKYLMGSKHELLLSSDELGATGLALLWELTYC